MTPDVADQLTDDLFFGAAVRLLQPRRGHRFGGDAALLAAAARSLLTPGGAVADLGAGVGAVGLALAAKGAGRALLVEIGEELAALAEENARRNGLSERTEVAVADVAAIARGGDEFAGAFDLVATNPPFDDAARHRASPHAGRARAHVDDGAVIPVWIGAARRLLRPGGAVVMIHRPEALGTLLAALDAGFGDARILPVHPRAEAPAGRIIMSARLGGRGPLLLRPPLVMHAADGGFTPEADAVQRGGMLDLS